MQNSITSTWLEVNLGAIRRNYQRLITLAGRPVMAVIKANAYGHGLLPVTRALVDAGATWLGAARVEEALSVREAGMDTPIMILGYMHPQWAGEAANNRITTAVYEPELAQAFSDQAVAAGTVLHVHAKVDTGMNRLGIDAENGVEFVRWLGTLPGLQVDGLFTHFAAGDEPNRPVSASQLQRFETLLDSLNAVGLRPPVVHAANSATTLNFPQARYDLVRCGIAVYGMHPSPETHLPEDFEPALSWKALLTSVKMVPPGEGISYNHRYITQKAERIGVTALGYGDGFRRMLDVNTALVRGTRVPVVGAVCMDQCMLQLDSVPEARVGDEVVLIGKQGETELRAEDVGQAWGTLNYDVVCSLGARVPRYYFDE